MKVLVADDELPHLVAERLKDHLEQTQVPVESRQQRVRISIGSAALRRGLPMRAETLVKAAGAPLYRAKARGRNRVAVAMEKDCGEDE